MMMMQYDDNDDDDAIWWWWKIASSENPTFKIINKTERNVSCSYDNQYNMKKSVKKTTRLLKV